MLHEIIEITTNYLINNLFAKEAVQILDRTWNLRLDINPDRIVIFAEELNCCINILHLFKNHCWDYLVESHYILDQEYLNGNLQLIRFLNKHKNFNYTVRKRVFLYAARYGHLDVVKFLVRLGINVKVQRNSALLMAASNGHLKMVKFLVKKGGDIRVNHGYLLILGAQSGNLKLVKYLINSGVDNHLDRAIRASEKTGHHDVAQYLRALDSTQICKIS